jgi:hypothetical protein
MRTRLSSAIHKRPSSGSSPSNGNDRIDDGQHVQLVLALEPKHDKSGIVSGRICLHVGEVNVEGDKRASLTPADLCNASVCTSAKPLVNDVYGVVPSLTQCDGDLNRKVLVDLEFHPPATRRSMTRSRASSAPYATAADTSSSVTVG